MQGGTMGGRGSSSTGVTGRGISRGRMLVEGIMADPDKTDRQKNKELIGLLKTEAGFSDVKGFTNYETESLAAITEALVDLEETYGAIRATKGDGAPTPKLSSTNAQGYHGKVGGFMIGGKPHLNMFLRRDTHVNADENARIHKAEQDRGEKSRTDGSRKALLQSTVVHEYGHLLHYAISDSKMVTTGNMRSRISSLAGTTEPPSRYAGSSASEYFAESFLSYRLGGSNMHAAGKGMGEYLKELGYGS